ncbi:MAG: TonB-dependent receptor plug domain-containing protein [Steroidobacteraceae bacterium]|nr:TonB-dependent receptor plug domain-containing protein [Steroidobacteraceae bacterium]
MLSVAAAAQESVTSLGIEEIVVTAQKREESLQAVPISISTLSTTDIERRGLQNSADLVGAIPNMGGFTSPGSRGDLAINLRGVGAAAPSNLSNDPAVAVYVDGVILGKQVGGSLDVGELERVEVLRGPQGTLYGRNSTGGAVNFITRKPSGELGGKITTTVGSDGLWGVRGALDTPTLGVPGEGLGALQASFSAQTRKRDGLYGRDANGGQDFDDIDRQAYRVALRWAPTDAVTVDYAFDRSKLDETATPEILVGLNPLALNPLTGEQTSRVDALSGMIQAGEYALLGAGPLAAAAGDPTFTRWLDSARALSDAYADIGSTRQRPRNGVADAYTGTTAESTGHSLTAAWRIADLGVLGDVEFKSITGWRDLDNRNFGDLDGVDNTIAPGGAGALNDLAIFTMYQLYEFQGGFPAELRQHPRDGMAKLWGLIDQYGGAGYMLDSNNAYEQFSQELQMIGSTGRLAYALGLYYFEDEGSVDSYQIAASPLAGPVDIAYDNETEATALYLQTTWTPPILQDKLAITLGYRHTEETKRVTYRYRDDGTASGGGLFSGDPLNLGVNLDYTGELTPLPTYGDNFEKDFSNDSGSVTLAYQLTAGANVFLRWSTGYRSGGFNGEIYNNPVEEETIEQWELGVKSEVLPGRLRINASLFSYVYDDMQVGMIEVSDSGQPTSFTGNAGKAERWGSELEVQWSPLDNLLVAASWAHLDGDFDRYPAQCGTGAYLHTCINTNDIAKRTNAADDQLSLVADWVFASTDWADLMAHVAVYWQDETYATPLWAGSYEIEGGSYPHIFDHIVMKDRTLVNARLGIENVQLPSGALRASLWVRNLLDEEYNTYGINFGSLGPITAHYGEPRTWGIDVSWEF